MNRNFFQKLCLALLFLSINTISYANAYEWKHVALKSQDSQVQVSLDYTTQEYRYYGHPVVQTFALWVNVTRLGLKPSDQVRAVILNFPYYVSSAEQFQSFQVDLEYAEPGRFTVNASQTLLGANIFNARQEIAIVVNGEWIQSESGQSNFGFRFVPYINP